MDNKEFLDYTGLQHYTEKIQTFVNTKIDNIVLKHNTEAIWAQATDFRPLDGEFIIYDPDETHPYLRYKRGRIAYTYDAAEQQWIPQTDGNGNVITMLLSDLPFESNIHIGPDEPENAPAGFLWLDTTDTSEIVNFANVEGVRF